MALEVTEVNLEYVRGDSKPITFVLSDENGTIIDLTGYTLPVLSVHSDPNPVDLTTEKFTINGVIPVFTDGKISFIPAEDATGSDQTPDVYFYDAQVLDAGGNKITFVKGRFTLIQDKAKD
jgi:hypothetical protein